MRIKKDLTRVNEQIRVKQVRLIDDDGKNVGTVPTDRALEMARTAGLDLVEVAAQASPPVCKIMDYGKYKYQKSKRDHEAKKSQHVIHIKEIKLRPTTDDHDVGFKLDHARKFLESKDKVKVTMAFRGREMAHVDLGRRLMDRLATEIAEVAVIEQAPRLEGRFMVMILAPKH